MITQDVTPITPLPSFLAPERPAAVDNLVEVELPLLTEELAEVISQINSTETNINSKESSVTEKYNDIQPHFDDIDLVAAAIQSGDLPTIIDDNDTSNLKTWSSEKINSKIDIHSKTEKTTPIDADEIMIADSASAWSLKKITWANIKTTLTSLFVAKVTSTDSAIVRFDGTTGAVQNSGVIIDNNNNIGVGLVNPLDKLHISAAGTTVGNGAIVSRFMDITNTKGIFLGYDSDEQGGSIYGANFISFQTYNGSAWGERARIDDKGNITVGATSKAWGSINKVIDIGAGATLNGRADGPSMELCTNIWRDSSSVFRYRTAGLAAMYDQASGVHYWSSANSGTVDAPMTLNSLMTLYSSGELFTQFNGASNTAGHMTRSASAAGTNYHHYIGQSGGVDVIKILGNGNIQNTNNSYGAISDAKLKENVIDTSPKLDKLMQVRVVNYNLIGDKQKQIGVIAQEIEQIFNGIVEETNDTNQKEVEKERVIPAVEEVIRQKLITEAVLGDDGTILEDAIYETVIIQEAKPETTEKYTETETVETGEVTKSVKYSIIYMMMLKGMQEMRAEYTAEIQSLKDELAVLKGAK